MNIIGREREKDILAKCLESKNQALQMAKVLPKRSGNWSSVALYDSIRTLPLPRKAASIRL